MVTGGLAISAMLITSYSSVASALIREEVSFAPRRLGWDSVTIRVLEAIVMSGQIGLIAYALRYGGLIPRCAAGRLRQHQLRHALLRKQ